MSETAYLEVILGPMFSGKTSRLVEIYKKCDFCNIPVIVINHVIDNRYDNDAAVKGPFNQRLITHDKVGIPCMKTDKLMSMNQYIIDNNYEVVLINEGQFFPDLVEFVEFMLLCGKKVHVCGLDGDFERKKFGQMLDLIPICDTVTKLTSLCSLCISSQKPASTLVRPGIFSKRITAEKEQTVVGSDNYLPVCRKCYMK